MAQATISPPRSLVHPGLPDQPDPRERLEQQVLLAPLGQRALRDPLERLVLPEPPLITVYLCF